MNKINFLLLMLMAMGCNFPQVSTEVNYSSETIIEPTPFAQGIISTDSHSEFDIMFSPDGEMAYFSRSAPEEKQKIYETKYLDGQFSDPVEIKELFEDQESRQMSNRKISLNS